MVKDRPDPPKAASRVRKRPLAPLPLFFASSRQFLSPPAVPAPLSSPSLVGVTARSTPFPSPISQTRRRSKRPRLCRFLGLNPRAVLNLRGVDWKPFRGRRCTSAW